MTKRDSELRRPIVVVLGAGKPFWGSDPAAIHKATRHAAALDWCMRAFAFLAPEMHFVGGYQIDRVRRQFPDLHYAINPDWELTNATASLLAAPLDSQVDHFVCYSDIVFESDVVRAVHAATADVVVAVDSSFLSRADSGPLHDRKDLEKATVVGGTVRAMGPSVADRDANALFVGIAKLSGAALEWIRRLRSARTRAHLHWSLSELIDHLRTEGFSVASVDIAGRWATFDEPGDVAHFVIGTKAETLERLRPMVRRSRILPQVSIASQDWEREADSETARTLRTFASGPLIVRSSARTEDRWDRSNAGRYQSIPNVAAEPTELARAIAAVFESYEADGLNHQVLVQPMLSNVAYAGVALTRTLRRGGPYYVINYDAAGRTDSVTSGTGGTLRMLVILRDAEPNDALAPALAPVLPALKELEDLVGHDSLDVEFAIDCQGAVYVLQLRPIVFDYRQWQSSDSEVNSLVAQARARLAAMAAPPPGLGGREPAFGVMPDWNPAEIVGTRPRRLALSLYQHLVTNDVWAQQRAECGFRDVRPCNLIVALAGHPYVDIRASFNSFVPAGLPVDLGDRLVEHYLARLKAQPQLHDKVEFEIVLTCRSFAFERRSGVLLDDDFSPEDVTRLRNCLGEITTRGVRTFRTHIDQVTRLAARRPAIERLTGPLERAWALLEDCRRFGTLPFAHLARQGFVAVEMLRSAVQQDVIGTEESRAFMQSLRTVASAFSEDTFALAIGRAKENDLIERYGHLRPGTYEITSPCYAQALHAQLAANSHTPAKQKPPFEWSPAARKSISAALERIEMPFTVEEFDAFLRGAIEAREWSKFEFTRHVSAALEAIAEFGLEYGLTREQLSHVTWWDLSAIRLGLAPGDIRQFLRRCAADGAQFHRSVQAVELPQLVFTIHDLHCFVQQENEPNFIGSGRVTAPVLDLASGSNWPLGELEGKIVIIERADPGYDWLFLKNIAGLITVYGGANSHMAIRAAEFGLPAAIGIGEVTYERMRDASGMLLDCDTRHLSVMQ